ncbi:MAG TPA: FtsX-like permease family protein [Candidatus Sulfotelmatobacter sp.]|nr:FtsX-like permease family protein [Candidatus Sulfotelmatobacter sp.]
MKFTALVLKNLLRSKRRTILTVLSIAVSLFIFSALTSLPTVANRVLADTASSVRIACRTKMGQAYPLPEAYKAKIAETPHVVAVTPDNFFGGIYHEVSDQFPNIAVDPERIDVMWPDWGFSPGGIEQFKKLRTACLVADGTMKRFHLNVGQQIQLRGATYYPVNVSLTIVGTIAKGPAPSFLVFRRDYLEEIEGRPGRVDNFWVRADSSQAVPGIIQSVNAKFANSSAETQCDSEAVFIGGVIGRFRMFFTLARILGLIVVVTIGLVAANAAAMSIRERRNEIAVMRSIGFRSPLILRLLIAESVVTALAGCMLGCGAAFALLKIFSVTSDVLGPFVGAMQIPPPALLETFLAAILIGVLSSYVPARSAARRNIVDTLRVVD